MFEIGKTAILKWTGEHVTIMSEEIEVTHKNNGKARGYVVHIDDRYQGQLLLDGGAAVTTMFVATPNLCKAYAEELS